MKSIEKKAANELGSNSGSPLSKHEGKTNKYADYSNKNNSIYSYQEGSGGRTLSHADMLREQKNRNRSP